MRRHNRSIALLAAALSLSCAPASASPLQQGVESFYAQLETLAAGHQYARAEQILDQYLASGKDPATGYFQLGKIYFDHEAWQRSAEFFVKSIQSRDTNDNAHQLLGLDWRELRRPDDAEAELLTAAKQNPSNKVSAYLAGHQLLLNGKVDAALPYLYSALESKPLYFQTLQALGLAQARLGNYGLAESYYRKAADSAQMSGDSGYSALMNLTILLLLGHDSARLQEGLNCAKRCETLKPDSSDAHFLAGKALFNLRLPEEAISELVQAAKLSPKDAKIHYLLAKIYDRLSQPNLAHKEWETFSRLQRRSGQVGMATVDPVLVAPESRPQGLLR